MRVVVSVVALSSLGACFQRAELCNGRDDDRDGVVDDAPTQAVDHFPDVDGDGFGDAASAPRTMCPAPGWVATGADCDDRDVGRFPGADERCDGLDDDCDGAVPADELDADRDGYASCNGDCDDGEARRAPGRRELCDGIDQDCDGSLGVGERDVDGDGFPECAGDCDPFDPEVYPGAQEVCDGADNNCDGVPEVATWPADADALRSLLAAGHTGRICLGPGDWEGPFNLGSGAWVTGAGRGRTRIRSKEHTLIAASTVGEPARLADLDLDLSKGDADSSEVRVGALRGLLDLSHVGLDGGVCAPDCAPAPWVGGRTLSDVAFTGHAGGPLALAESLDDVRLEDMDLVGAEPALDATSWVRGVVIRDIRHAGALVQGDRAVEDVLLEDLDGIPGPAVGATLIQGGSEISGLRAARITLPPDSALLGAGSEIRDVWVEDVVGALELPLVSANALRGVTVWRARLTGEGPLFESQLAADVVVLDVQTDGDVWRGLRDGRRLDLRQVRARTLLSASSWSPTTLSNLALADVRTTAALFGADVALRFATLVRAEVGGPLTPKRLTVVASTFSEVRLPTDVRAAAEVVGSWNNIDRTTGIWWTDAEGGQRADPRHLRVDAGPAAAWDLHLGPDSPLRDAGPPDLRDADGTRADIGVYGGDAP